MSTTSRLPVLMYHSVSSASQRQGLCVPRQTLGRQLAALTDAGYVLLGLTEALRASEDTAPRRVVALTFDDGYADFLDALDVLHALSARATLYLCTGHVGDSSGLVPEAGPLLDWLQVESLPGWIEVGSHARRHRPLDTLRPSEIVEQVAGSRNDLRDRLGLDAASFCYPHGYSSRTVRRVVSAAGYDNACVIGRGLADVRGDRFALERVQVRPDDDERAVLRLVQEGEPGWLPAFKRIAYPPWRLVRRLVVEMDRRRVPTPTWARVGY